MKILSRNTALLLLLALLFLAPGLTALYFYQHPQWLSGQATNKGVFIHPAIKVKTLLKPYRTLKPLEKAKFTWHLLLWNPGDCDVACLNTLEQLARIRLALGRHFYDVDEVLMMGSAEKGLPRFVQEIRVLQLSHDDQEIFRSLSGESKIFIANPSGFLILSYPVTTSSDDIYHDLKQLLTTSQTKSN